MSVTKTHFVVGKQFDYEVKFVSLDTTDSKWYTTVNHAWAEPFVSKEYAQAWLDDKDSLGLWSNDDMAESLSAFLKDAKVFQVVSEITPV